MDEENLIMEEIDNDEFDTENSNTENQKSNSNGSNGDDSDANVSDDSDDVEQEESILLRDVASWEIPLSEPIRVEIIKKGSGPFQIKEGPFSDIRRPIATGNLKGGVRHFSGDWFYKLMPDGQKILRTWMVYSTTSHSPYCFCCRLFIVQPKSISSKFVTGFDKWWKLNPKVERHESSRDHIENLELWKTMCMNLRLGMTIDARETKLIDQNKKKWRDILTRLLDIIVVLVKQNLAFRGHKEDETSLNRGNFLELVDLLSKYDPVLKEHPIRFKKSIGKKKIPSYLSSEIQNQFITVLSKHVKDNIIREIKAAGYYGIMFDNTPDLSHTDQMSEIIRYVHISDGKVEVKEVFLCFFPLKENKGC